MGTVSGMSETGEESTGAELFAIIGPATSRWVRPNSKPEETPRKVSFNRLLSLGTAAKAGLVKEPYRAWCSWPFLRDKVRETAGCSEVTPGGSSRSGGVNTVDVGRSGMVLGAVGRACVGRDGASEDDPWSKYLVAESDGVRRSEPREQCDSKPGEFDPATCRLEPVKLATGATIEGEPSTEASTDELSVSEDSPEVTNSGDSSSFVQSAWLRPV